MNHMIRGYNDDDSDRLNYEPNTDNDEEIFEDMPPPDEDEQSEIQPGQQSPDILRND